MSQLRQGLARTSRLAEQMLVYSRTQDANDREPAVALRLADIVRDAVAALDPLRQAKSQQIEVLITQDAQDACILGEPIKIQRLIVNLLDNASRYAPASSTIVVTVSTLDDAVVCSVANTGRPIPLELRERVFEPYYRIPGSGSEGSGLGLAIVMEIANQHGAVIELGTQTATEGTRISVRFRRV